ncbi:MAG TPA: PAS domain-containing sensor histidine kinase [Acidimicrobiales bacterium]|nr:PAS domain-containing sensor histidine kinase [Acidimicrobiales bacterium]
MSAPELVDLLPDAVLRLGADRTILAANAAAGRLTGYGIDDLVGADCRALLDPRNPEGRPVWPNGWHPSASLRSVRRLPEQEVTLRRYDTATVRTFVTGQYERGDDGTLVSLVLVLRESGARTHKATSGIEIVSTVSHELRSPLTSVKGYTSLLLTRWDRISDEQKREMLEQVKHDADRVHRLITELLDISRLETDRLVLRRQMVDLQSLIATVIEKVRFSYQDIEVDLRFDDGFPEVYADPDKMEQVLTNLVENACKYASPQGMRIEARVHEDHASLAITDAGEGIPEEDLPKVFTKFFRRELGKPTGSGLGLWISRGLVEAHGGQLTATSTRGQGTTFSFTLPLMAFEELHGA